ncbi:hypothetical protein MCOR29_011671 [Pyricularia oryzae]|uniref:Uncharacterized protein n=1 Tax=Pyricularia oryzae TaxID=318829 RepID=A0A4P7N3Z0_PYROR|nr:hypothetical protein MCOR19_011669 [Pyricularia oryzae]KAI6292570.1 hypothetical protein MCOR29_011671 [Pyricularia oryzae]KAI6421536.1 hypothetical protein MCOR22_011576 [Pyricularia oryzae]KAI6507507.1 hypothetical protein MCOR10_011183 [Pyricularia oryzae]QBZ57207.1 hypothetical protein PoMZ_02131 [Pyricularia oryzae]
MNGYLGVAKATRSSSASRTRCCLRRKTSQVSKGSLRLDSGAEAWKWRGVSRDRLGMWWSSSWGFLVAVHGVALVSKGVDGWVARQQVSPAHALVDMNPRHHPLKVSGVSVGAAR